MPCIRIVQGNIPTNLRPNKDVVDGVIRRYQNAVHWIDYAIEEFVELPEIEGALR